VSRRDFATTRLGLVEVGETLLEPSVHVFVNRDVLLERSVVERLQAFTRVVFHTRGDIVFHTRGDFAGGRRAAGILRIVVHKALLSAADGIRPLTISVR
jgi:hypothetical protein